MEEDEKTLVMFPGVKPIVAPDGPKWQPSNAEEGEVFHEAWCYRCAKFGEADELINATCPIQVSAMLFTPRDPDYPREWQIRNGRPVCTAWEGK